MNNLKVNFKYLKYLKNNFIYSNIEWKKHSGKFNKIFKMCILKTFNYIVERNFKRPK